MNFRHLENKRRGRRVINKNYLLCRSPAIYHHIDPGGIDSITTSATPVSGILEFMEPDFVRRFLHSPDFNISQTLNGTYIFSGLNSNIRLREIACRPFTNVMKEINVRNIDVWVLDVEGNQHKVTL